MRIRAFIATLVLIAGGFLAAAPAANAVWCKDGTWSNSTGRGTCSWHGGIDRSRGGYGSGYSGLNDFSYGNSWGNDSWSYGSRNNRRPSYGGLNGNSYGNSWGRGSLSDDLYGNSYGGGSLYGGSLSDNLYGNSYGW